MTDILSTDQAAAALGISRRRLRAIVAAGTVTPARLGRSLIWTEADLAVIRPRLNEPKGRPGAPSGERNWRHRSHRASEVARTAPNALSTY
jgi:hypothetical protein